MESWEMEKKQPLLKKETNFKMNKLPRETPTLLVSDIVHPEDPMMDESICDVDKCVNPRYKNRKFCKLCLDKFREREGFFTRSTLPVRERKDRRVERRDDATHEDRYDEDSNGSEHNA